MAKLRIAQVAPVARPVDPDTGGSIEQLVSLLTEELVRRGHQVTLFATGDSRTSASVHATYAAGYDHDEDLWEWEFHETLHTAAAFERAGAFDVIHTHNYHFGLPFVRLVPTPVVQTYHVLPEDHVIRAYALYPEVNLVATSHYQRQKLRGLSDVPVIHHGIDTETFPFGAAGGDYLVFLGRVMPHKGPYQAIEVAREVGMPLVIAGPCDPEYFEAAIRPLVDGRQVEYVGPVGPVQRNALLSRAAALVYPVAVSEPFGLVMVEAMSCGTPVVAFRRGAVPEIVDEGISGYVVDDVATMASSIPAVLSLDRGTVRDRAVERFDFGRMVNEYEALYLRLAAHTDRWAS